MWTGGLRAGLAWLGWLDGWMGDVRPPACCSAQLLQKWTCPQQSQAHTHAPPPGRFLILCFILSPRRVALERAPAPPPPIPARLASATPASRAYGKGRAQMGACAWLIVCGRAGWLSCFVVSSRCSSLSCRPSCVSLTRGHGCDPAAGREGPAPALAQSSLPACLVCLPDAALGARWALSFCVSVSSFFLSSQSVPRRKST